MLRQRITLRASVTTARAAACATAEPAPSAERATPAAQPATQPTQRASIAAGRMRQLMHDFQRVQLHLLRLPASLLRQRIL